MIGGVLAEGEVLWILDRVPFRKADEPMEWVLGKESGPSSGHLPKVTLLVSGGDQGQICVFTRSPRWKLCPAASNSGVHTLPNPPSRPRPYPPVEGYEISLTEVGAVVALVCISGQVGLLYSLRGHLGHCYPQGL